MSQTRNRSNDRSASRSPSKSKSRSRSRSGSLSSTSSGRAAKARDWNGESGYRLHVSPLNPRTSRRDIEQIFSKFGPVNEVWMATNPPCFAFVNFKHRADAEDAIQGMDGKTIDNSRVGVSFARKRTIGGRRGGGGGYSNGGDRYSRGGRDSPRYRRRYSPRHSDEGRDKYNDRRRRHSRSRSPVQHKRDYRPRSRSSSPKARRNRPSSRDRSPQQQAANVVHRQNLMGRSRDREGSLSSTGSGRTARSKKWDGQTGHRVHLSDLSVGVSKHEIENLFRPYGELNEIWVASNPPCFSFINFLHRSDGERAIKELDGTIFAGSRIGLSWARPRHYGGRSRYRSPSPSYRRSFRDSYSSRRRYSRSRSRSPYYRRSGGGSSRRRTRSPSPRDRRRDERTKTSKHEHKRRRHSSSNSDRSDKRSSRRDNGNKASRSPSNERHKSTTSNGDNRPGNSDDNRVEVELDTQD